MQRTQVPGMTEHAHDIATDGPSGTARVLPGDTTQGDDRHSRGQTFENVTTHDNARVHMGDVHNNQHTHYHGTPYSHADASELSLLEALAFEQMNFRSATIAPAYGKTCDWLFDASPYKRWRNQDLAPENNGFLWIKGKPGAGKSTIMKHAWEHAQAKYDDEKTVSFFFNARGTTLGKSVEGMYRCLLHQMADQVPHLERKVSNADRNEYRSKGWPVAVLQDLSRQAVLHLSQHTKVSFYIDALDEGDDEDQVRGMVEFFYEVAERAVSKSLPFHMCLASRYYPKISVASYEELRLEDYGGHDADISEYVHNKLRLRNLQLKQHLSAEIRRRSSSVFLWVVLVVAILNKENDRGNQHLLLTRLREIPDGLLELFKDLRGRDPFDDRFVPAIEWILHAMWPLDPKELHIAILTSTGALTAENCASIQQNIYATTADDCNDFIVSSSKGFLEIVADTRPSSSSGRRVQFIHETVREYFLVSLGLEYALVGRQANAKHCDNEPLASTTNVVFQAPAVSRFLEHEGIVPRNNPHGKSELGSISSKDTIAISHARLSQICQRYIRISHASDSQQKSQPQHTDLPTWHIEERPFLQYSLDEVLNHANAASESGWLISNLPNDFPWDEWAFCKIAIDSDPDHLGYDHMYTWLQRMVHEGMPSLVNDELASISANAERSQQGVETAQVLLNACASDLGSALHIAAWRSHLNLTCLQLLLESGADVNKACKHVGTPLHSIVSEMPHNLNGVRLLLKHGADPNAKDHRGNSPLHYAILARVFGLVEILVGHGADLNGRIGAHGNASQTAWLLNNVNFVVALANLRADVDKQNFSFAW